MAPLLHVAPWATAFTTERQCSIHRLVEKEREPEKVRLHSTDCCLRWDKEVQRENLVLSQHIWDGSALSLRSFRLDYESIRRAAVNRLPFLHMALYFARWLLSFTCTHPSSRLSAQMDFVWLGNKYFLPFIHVEKFQHCPALHSNCFT